MVSHVKMTLTTKITHDQQNVDSLMISLITYLIMEKNAMSQTLMLMLILP